jgi:phthiodiolone/phenolphthiodiolone dimycocerosates ketoreductase
MKFGLNIVCTHPFDIPEMAMQMAIEAQVDSVWTPDHLLGMTHPELWPEMSAARPGTDPDAWYDPFVSLALLGRRSTIPMGVCVTDTTRRRVPDLVRTALTLHHLCPGGFNLGIGCGEAQNLEPFGYPFSTPVKHTEQFLGEMRSFIDSGKMPPPMRGRRGLPDSRDDVGRVRIWVGGHGPRMLRLTGMYGDGWLPAWPMTPAVYGERREVMAGHAEAAGRPLPECAMHVAIVLGESHDYVAGLFEKEPLAKLMTLMCAAETWTEHGLSHPGGESCRGLVDAIWHDYDPDELRSLAPKIPVEILDQVFFMGNVEEIVERLEGYAVHGLQHIVFANSTGLVGGQSEAIMNAPQFFQLRKAVNDL